MHIVRKIFAGITFLGSWLALLIRFGASKYDNYLFYTDERPSVGYINAIGLGVAIVYLFGGFVLGAVVTGALEHSSIKRSLAAFFGCIVLLVAMLAGADLALAILEIQHFVVVHCDIAFLCTVSILYALLPSEIRPPPTSAFTIGEDAQETLLNDDSTTDDP